MGDGESDDESNSDDGSSDSDNFADDSLGDMDFDGDGGDNDDGPPPPDHLLLVLLAYSGDLLLRNQPCLPLVTVLFDIVL